MKRLVTVASLAATLPFAPAQPARAQGQAMDALIKEAGPQAAALVPPARPAAAMEAVVVTDETLEDKVRELIGQEMRKFYARADAIVAKTNAESIHAINCKDYDRIKPLKDDLARREISLLMAVLGPAGRSLAWEEAAPVIFEPNFDSSSSFFYDQYPLSKENYGDTRCYAQMFTSEDAIQKVQDTVSAISDNRDYILARVRLDKSPGAVLAQANPDVLAAAAKLSGGSLSGKGPFGTFTKDGKRGVLTKEEALADLKAAFGAVPESELPAEIRGFRTADVLALISDWLGPEGLQKFQRRATTQGGESIIVYGLPMLDGFAQANLTPLRRILDEKWVQMPVEKAALWAAEELAIDQGVPTDDLLTATPKALYVRRKDYPAFMNLYARDKRTLSGEEIANAVNGFKSGLLGKLDEIRQSQLTIARAIDAGTDAASAALGGVSDEIAGVRAAINVGTLADILLRFAH